MESRISRVLRVVSGFCISTSRRHYIKKPRIFKVPVASIEYICARGVHDYVIYMLIVRYFSLLIQIIYDIIK
jgi:hypothetical protein